MTSTHRRRRGAFALVALAGALTVGLPFGAHADTSTETAEPATGGAVEVSYADVTEIRPGEGWLIDCGGVGALDGIQVTCAEDTVTLVSAGFDPDLGTQTLTVPQVFGGTRISVDYRVRLENPPVPEAMVDRLDLPIPVGEQALVPISALRISCAVCTADGGATLAVDDSPPEASEEASAAPDDGPYGVSVGVSATHLTLRGSVPGDRIVPLTITDDAGQSVSLELTVTFVDVERPALGRST